MKGIGNWELYLYNICGVYFYFCVHYMMWCWCKYPCLGWHIPLFYLSFLLMEESVHRRAISPSLLWKLSLLGTLTISICLPKVFPLISYNPGESFTVCLHGSYLWPFSFLDTLRSTGSNEGTIKCYYFRGEQDLCDWGTTCTLQHFAYTIKHPP